MTQLDYPKIEPLSIVQRKVAPASEQIGASGPPSDALSFVEAVEANGENGRSGPLLECGSTKGDLALRSPLALPCGPVLASASTPPLRAGFPFPKRSDAATLALCVAPGVALPSFPVADAGRAACAPLSNTGALRTQTNLTPQNLPKPQPKPKRKEEQKELLTVAAADPMPWRFEGFLIDWLRFTVIPEEQQREVLATWRGEPGDWTDQDTSHMGYRRCYRSDGVTIYYDHAKEGRGICIDICGSGCRKLEAAGRVAVGAGWTNLLRTLTTTPGVNITRLDTAIDDRKGLIDLDAVQECIDGGLVVSRFSTAYCIEKKSLSTGDSSGKTVNFGSRSSDLMVRMYNKAAEQKLDTGEHWTRVEVEAKDENAVALAVALADAGSDGAGAVVAGVLRNYLSFRVKSSTDSNKRRWAVLAWWDEFLQGVGALRLAVAKAAPTLESVRSWLEKQCAPSLAMLFDREKGCYGRSLLDALVEGGAKRLRPKHKNLVAAERRRVALVAPAGGPTGF